MKTIGLSIGGSILSTEKGFDAELGSKLAALIREKKDTRFIVVIGGGNIARSCIASLKSRVKNMHALDEVGTLCTRINALMFRWLFNDTDGVNPTIPTTLDEVKRAFAVSRVVVLGGMIEGITTDTDTVLACEAVGATEMINISRVSYVYDKDPKLKGAKKLERMSYDQMIELANSSDSRAPGTNFVFDIVAAKLVKRSGIKVYFSDANIENLRNIIEKKKSYGTIVQG